VDPEKHTLDGLLVLLCHDPAATQSDNFRLANSGRAFTLNQLESDHAHSNQMNTIKQLVDNSGTGIRSPQAVRVASKTFLTLPWSFAKNFQAHSS
jgi:hypothetical protein